MPSTPELVHFEFGLAVAGRSFQVGKAPVSDTKMNRTSSWLRCGDPGHECGTFWPVKLSE